MGSISIRGKRDLINDALSLKITSSKLFMNQTFMHTSYHPTTTIEISLNKEELTLSPLALFSLTTHLCTFRTK